jgi:hypothetical protein
MTTLTLSQELTQWLQDNADSYDFERWTADVEDSSAPWNAEEFSSAAALKAAVTSSGSPFFSKETMRFFGSKVCGDIRGRRFIITCENNFDSSARLYSVRWFHKYADAVQLSGSGLAFQKYETLQEARQAITVLQGICAEVNASK